MQWVYYYYSSYKNRASLLADKQKRGGDRNTMERERDQRVGYRTKLNVWSRVEKMSHEMKGKRRTEGEESERRDGLSNQECWFRSLKPFHPPDRTTPRCYRLRHPASLVLLLTCKQPTGGNQTPDAMALPAVRPGRASRLGLLRLRSISRGSFFLG